MKKCKKSPRRHLRAAASTPAPAPTPTRARDADADADAGPADSVTTPAPVATRRRHNGWTPARQLAFLEALAESGCVTEACAAVNISAQSAYRLRMRIDAQAFRIAWDAALDLGIRRLSDACLSRALHGEPVPHFYQGEQIGEHRRYDNRLAMFLLRYRDPLRYAASLDQMVYSGHPERAALAFTHARDRAADAAYGIDPDPPGDAAPADAAHDRSAPPWSKATIDQTVDAAREQAMIAGDAPITGSAERRARLSAMRARRHADRFRDEADEEAALLAHIRLLGERLDREAAAAAAEAAAALAERAAGGDVASLSSLSAPDPARPRPPPDAG